MIPRGAATTAWRTSGEERLPRVDALQGGPTFVTQANLCDAKPTFVSSYILLETIEPLPLPGPMKLGLGALGQCPEHGAACDR